MAELSSGFGRPLLVFFFRSNIAILLRIEHGTRQIVATAGHRYALKAGQHAAVEFGVGEGVSLPRLIIARAGPAKTATLAHWAAHFQGNGADPRRILLMTFARRAVSGLTKRIERVAAQAMGAAGAAGTLAWVGTFRRIGARILRVYALWIGPNPEFSIHDRDDSADLINLCRHAEGFSKSQH